MATEAPVDIGTLITSTPGVQGGKPCIAGTSIRVQTIAIRHQMGEHPEEFVKDWPYLELAHFYAALAYYYANKKLIDTQIEGEERFVAKLMARYPNGLTRESFPSEAEIAEWERDTD